MMQRRMFDSPEARADKGGARVWLETYFDVDVFVDQDWQLPVESGSIFKVQLKIIRPFSQQYHL